MNKCLDRHIEIRDIMYVATSLGKLILQNGGETYRTEDTIVRTCAHYGLRVSSFATLNTIITSINLFDNEDVDKEYTVVDRINFRTTNLKKVYLFNDLARSLDKYTIEEVKEKIKEINSHNEIIGHRKLMAFMLSGASCAVLFGGNIKDSIAAVVIMFFLGTLNKFLYKHQINVFFINMCGSALATMLAVFFFKMGLIEDISIAIISALMLLTPGIAMTNSIRDVISGDFVSGISRGIEAIAVAIALAAGSGIVLSITFKKVIM